MVYVLARHEIEDYERWEAHHEANAETRAAHGSLGTRAFRVRGDPDDGPTEVVVLQEIDDDRLDEALAYYGSPAFRDVLETAGVREVVDAAVVDEVHDSEA